MIQRSFRYYYLKVTRQRGTPENIALGMAIGVFFGLFIPAPQMILAVSTATLAKANRITALLGTWISNPFTFPFMITFYIIAGQHLTGLHLKNVQVPQPTEATAPAKPGETTKPADPNKEEVSKKKKKKRKLKLPLKSGELFIFIFSQGGKLVVVWFAASTLTALIGAFISYHVTRILVESFRRRRRRRQKRRRMVLERKAAEEEAIRGIHMGLDDQ